MCDTSYFTAVVSGVGNLGLQGSYELSSLCLNIASNHPQTLKISLTSPSGITLLLSSFNGTSGVNYSNCCFSNSGGNITTANAPFTGSWQAQGGSFNIFNGHFGDGLWTISVIDTACQSGSSGTGSWTDGNFLNGMLNFSSIPICTMFIPNNQITICPGDSVDILGYYMNLDPFPNYFIQNAAFNPVSNPSAVTAPGVYHIYASVWTTSGGCDGSATFTISTASTSVGADQSIVKCVGNSLDLNNIYNLFGFTPNWTLNGVPISSSAT